MKILAIQPSVPFGLTSGFDIRNAAVLRALSEAGDLTTLVLRGKLASQAPDWVNLVTLDPEAKGSIWKTGVLHPLSTQIQPFEKKQISALIARIKPDVVVIEGVLLRGVLPLLAKARVPTVLDMHNIESDLLPQLLAKIKWRYWPGNYLRELIKLAVAPREDRRAAHMAGQVWVCSYSDVDRLNALTGIIGKVVPNPIPNPQLLKLRISAERYSTPHLVYVGQLKYAPNADAVKTLCLEITPKLPSGSVLQIVGINAPIPLRTLIASSGATLVDSPRDLTPYLAASGYSIMPINLGGGTRIKVLEALAAGLVVIATDKAVEGLRLTDGKHYIAAQTPAESLSCLQKCLDNPENAAKIAQQGRAFVEQNFGAETISLAVTNALDSLTSS
ncbi:MAG: glycosyltransferase [Rhodobacteraceae bacterium]|nr:glycosyltransferase [Paracoccaceae bacterium]